MEKEKEKMFKRNRSLHSIRELYVFFSFRIKSMCKKTNVCFSSLRGKPVRRGGQAAAPVHPGRLADAGHHGVLPAGGQHPAGEPAHRGVQVGVAGDGRVLMTPPVIQKIRSNRTFNSLSEAQEAKLIS